MPMAIWSPTENAANRNIAAKEPSHQRAKATQAVRGIVKNLCIERAYTSSTSCPATRGTAENPCLKGAAMVEGKDVKLLIITANCHASSLRLR